MNDSYLVLNTGSSSIRFQLFNTDRDLSSLVKGHLSGIGVKCLFKEEKGNQSHEKYLEISNHHEGIRFVIEWLNKNNYTQDIKAIGHRIVYGGDKFCSPVLLNEENIKELTKFNCLAPLHQMYNLEAAESFCKDLPHIPQIACFDTAFHSYHEKLNRIYALPEELRKKGIERQGFHGLSYEWVVKELFRQSPDLAQGKIVVAHLGSGSSVCGIHKGQSVDSSMGFTVLDGLPMATRCGALDPGAVLYMIDELNMPPDKVKQILYTESGLKGLSGLSGDVGTLLKSDTPNSKLALDYFCFKAAQFIAMMAVSLKGIDTVVFTGGIGENAPSLREKIMDHIKFLKVANILTVPANEERMIAMHIQSFF